VKVLFTHRDGEPGRAINQLRDRLHALRGTADLEAEFLLEHDGGIGQPLARYGAVHVQANPARLRELVDARRYDAVVAIDTAEHVAALRGASRPPVILELTPAARLDLVGPTASPGGVIVSYEYGRQRLAACHGVADADIRVVPPTIDPTAFRPLPVAERPRRPIVLWVGCLDDRETWAGFVEVAVRLSIATSDIDFWLVGGNTPSEETTLCLLGAVEASGLSARFRWFPRIEYGAMPGVYSYVRASGGALLVSGQDTSSATSVAESLLAGCPVVAPRDGAIAEIACERPYLHLYALGDTEEASRILHLTLFEHHALVCDTLAADRAALAARWSPEATAPVYLATLRELAARKS
jgi:L-malate glycosyltransferase